MPTFTHIQKFINNGGVLAADYDKFNYFELDWATAQITFHARGDYGATLLVWPAGQQAGDASPSAAGYTVSDLSGIGLLTRTTLCTPRLNPQAAALTQDGSVALAVNAANHIFSLVIGGVPWTDLGAIGFTCKTLLGLPDASQHFVAAGSTVSDTQNNGVAWTTRVGNLLAVDGAPDIIGADYLP